MKHALIVLYAFAAMQMFYNVLTFNKLVHGEVAWRLMTCNNATCLKNENP